MPKRRILRVHAIFAGVFVLLSLLSFTFVEQNQGIFTLPDGSDSLPTNAEACESPDYMFYYTSSDRFKAFSDSVYLHMFSESNRPNKKVFNYALKGYAGILARNMAIKQHILAFIDYSVSSNKKRFWVVDLRQLKVLYHELVAHGRNSGEEYARRFSNKENSFQTSLGFFITGEIYQGKHALSIRMNGVEKGFNGKALDRGIVIHGADYVDERFISAHKRLGRSLGCPAVSEKVIGGLSSVISDGVVLFSYYPHKSYLKSSRLLNSDVLFAQPLQWKSVRA